MEIKLTVVPGEKKSQNSIQVDDGVFSEKFNEPLVHQVVVAYRAGGRAGTRAQKSKSEVRGGGIKPWKQKGTGRARAGSIRSPLWRGGGVTFASKPEDFSQKVNKKMYRIAMRSIFSELVRQGRLVVVEGFSVANSKTKDLLKKLHELKLSEVLIVTEDVDSNLYLAARNLPKVDVVDVGGVNPVSLIGFEKVLITASAVKKVEEMFA